MDDSVSAMGGATAASSPQDFNAADLDNSEVVDFGPISGLAAAGQYLAVRTRDGLTLGSAQELKSSRATTLPLSADCGELTAHQGYFIVACPQSVELINADNHKVESIAIDPNFHATSATRISTGEVFVASNSTSSVLIYKDGQKQEEIRVQAPTDQLIAVANEGGADNVVRTWRADTTIQNIDWQNSREGGRLRVGRGLGRISTGESGVVIAADTLTSRLAVYTAQDVVRLHQFGNTDGVPWATAWDSQRELAWVSTTDNNQVQAFAIASGVPQQRGSYATVPDAQYLAATNDGTIAIASTSGAGLQLLKP